MDLYRSRECAGSHLRRPLFAGMAGLILLGPGLGGAHAGTASRPFQVQVTVLPSGQTASVPAPTAGGANTRLSASQKQRLLQSTPAPSVTIIWQ